MRLSVIIPCYNAADTIAIQLGAMAKQHWSEPWEVIVSDNGSTDQTLSVIEQYKSLLPNFHVVDSSDRQGAAHARNVGALTASGDAFLFCDADDAVAPGWLRAIGDALYRYDFVASRFEFQKLNPSWMHESQGTPQQDGLQRLWYPPYLPHAGGSGIGVKRSVHESVGGFDESIVRLEDTDYCIKAQITGVKIHFVHDAVVHIRHRNTASGMFKQRRLWGLYNVLLYKRYRPAGSNPTIRPWISYVKSCVHLICRLPQIRHQKGRIACVRSLGYLLGQFHGAVKYWVPPV